MSATNVTSFKTVAGDGYVAVDGLELGGSVVTSSELAEYSLNVYMADANTAGSAYVVAPHAGNIVGLHATNYVANTTTKTVLLAKLGGTNVTAPAWEIAVTQAAGVASSVVPTAARAVTAGQVIEINSDGGGSPVMPIMVTIVISR